MPSGEPCDIPRRIGKYEILDLISRGGMAEIFLGRARGDAGFEKLVAVKRILPELAEEERFIKMFFDEARISAELTHSNIAQIFELNSEEELPFLALEYIQGVNLQTINRYFQNRQMAAPPSLATYIMIRICNALEYAHTRQDSHGRPRNIIHRDVSPGNILVSFEGEVKLVDFGIARATQRTSHTAVGTIKGKCAYMPPELLRKQSVDHRADIFAAGGVFYELITGAHPFRGDDDLKTLELVREARAPMPSSVEKSVPPELDHICIKALASDPGDRYASAALMEQDLEQYQQQAHLSRTKVSAWLKKTFHKRLQKLQDVLRQQPPATPAPVASKPKPAPGVPPKARPGSENFHQAPTVVSHQSDIPTAPTMPQPPARPVNLKEAPTEIKEAPTEIKEAPKEIKEAPTEIKEAPTEIKAAAEPPQPPARAQTWPALPPKARSRRRLLIPFFVVLGILVLLAFAAQVGYVLRKGPRLLPRPAAPTPAAPQQHAATVDAGPEPDLRITAPPGDH